MPKKWRVYCSTEATNVYIVSDTTPAVCPNNAGHTINASSVCVIDDFPAGSHLFGDGSDGNVTIAVNTTLARDMYYRNLTITSAAVITPNGYRIFVSDTITFTSGSINANGGNGTGQTAGAIPHSAKTLGGGAVGGTGGATNAVGSNGGTLTSNTRMGGLGSAGGASNVPRAGGTGGTGTVPSDNNGGTILFKSVTNALRGRDLANTQLLGGSGGGGGGGSAAGVGGGGGGGGGVLLLCARNIVVTSGSITADGGNGGTGVATAGGGGGGGGGCAIVISATDTSAMTITANGGAGGVTGGAGTNGTAGGVGQVFRILI